MKKVLIPILICAFSLTGCSFLKDFLSNNDDNNSNSGAETITSFDFVTDANMTTDTTGDSTHYILNLYVGDTYQIKTNIDDKIGNNYYFEYSDFDNAIVDISDAGLVTANGKGVDSVMVRLMQKSNSRRICTNYFVVNVKDYESEYANITLNDSSLDYDSSTKTYSLSLKGGDLYQIITSINYNVNYNRLFKLSDDAYSSFMSVNPSGLITTQKTTEDKDGQVTIQTLSIDNSKIYDTVYLNVHIEKSEDIVTNDLVISDISTGDIISNDDNYSLYLNDSMTFSIKYGGANKYNAMSISNSEVLTLDNATNKITAKWIGKSDVTFAYEDKTLTIHIEVIKNALIEIYAKNGGSDFVIVNDKLSFLGRMFAKYQSGLEIDISESESLKYDVSALNSTQKRVTFTFSDDGVNKQISYDVLYFVTEEYVTSNSAYDLSDYFNNRYRNNVYVLPKEGNIKMLVIPIWFNNSNTFFRENQKAEILGDLDYVFNATRDKDSYYSLKQFYYEESKGKLSLDITISDFYESGTSSKNYGDTEEADIKRTHTLADSAINWYFNNHTDESIDDYDGNNDGFVDAVTLLYAANYYGTIGDSNGTIAFQFKNSEGNTHKYNNGSFIPIGELYGFNKNSDVSKQLNAEDLSKYYPPYFFNTGVRVVIHETGHMFGFVDLYEDNHASTKYFPAGRFSMQSSNYGGHDPYHLNLLGWGKPQIYSASDYEVGEKITVSINDFIKSGNNIILTKEKNAYNSLFDEYMLLELLAPTGLNYYDAKNSPYSFNDPGIRLWHVNSILEDMSNDNKNTSEISNTNVVNLKYSNNDQSSEYDLLHWIRNNQEEDYDTVSTVKDSYGLFGSGDHFDMTSFQSQFVNKDKLDNKEKLGWEFDVDSVYQTIDDNFGAVITLTRVDNTRTDFEFNARIDKDISEQPTSDGKDFAKELLGDDELFSLIYNFNNATAPSYYIQGKPISYKGVCLFASTDGNGGSLVISIKNKDGYITKINSISITYSLLTNASVTAFVDGNVITGESFVGPYNQYDEYKEGGLSFLTNSKTITIQNKYTGSTDYKSVITIYSLSIDYHFEKI